MAESRLARKKLETRDRILREAAKLFDKKGFVAATVDEIVVLADVSKGTFFNYFKRKDDLLLTVVDQRQALAEASAAEILSLAIPVRDQLMSIFSEAAHAWEEDREWSRHVLEGLGGGALAGRTRSWAAWVRRCIERGQKSGEFRSGVDPERTAALFLAIYHDTLARWGGRAEIELQAELREQLALVLDGVATS
ncbi:MAG TPA: TetR/AcrR family transcriptional regulator [Candidatus Udaeobacter sp.]|jgi:AcrR family transcriptional regulator|nr:TetR/AcrR family transcriptional regulator [Candidatus Udaeobacter sp.]